jgi:death-on-curing protein
VADRSDPALTALLARLRTVLAEPVDFAATDTDSSLAKVRLLTAAATYFNILAVTDFGGRTGPLRAEGLLEQAVAAAFQTYGEEDPHPDPFQKAAMLLRGITQGHPFTDGNKRVGFLTAAYYLTRVGHSVPDPLDVDAAEVLCMGVSAGNIRDVEAIATSLRELWREP